MTCPDSYLLWVEIKWTLTPKRSRTKMPEGFDPFERMSGVDVEGKEIP